MNMYETKGKYNLEMQNGLCNNLNAAVVQYYNCPVYTWVASK